MTDASFSLPLLSVLARPTRGRTAAASLGDRVPSGNGVRSVMATGHPQGD